MPPTRPAQALQMLAESEDGAVWQHPTADQVVVQWGQTMLAMSPLEFDAFRRMVAGVRQSRPADLVVLPGGTR